MARYALGQAPIVLHRVTGQFHRPGAPFPGLERRAVSRELARSARVARGTYLVVRSGVCGWQLLASSKASLVYPSGEGKQEVGNLTARGTLRDGTTGTAPSDNQNPLLPPRFAD